MSNLKERLDLLRQEIQKDEFLDGSGLSFEVNIRMFCYDAKDEMIVSHFLKQLRTDQTLKCRIIECNLYKIFLEACEYEPHIKGDILTLTGIGDVFPFMRVHALLEALQPQFSDIPILVMYPGKFDGYHLTLFDRLKPNDYYRAFNIVCGV